MMRTFDHLLARHTVIRTDDPAELHAYIAGMEGHHTRSLAGSGPVQIELRHAALGRLDVALHHTTVAMTVEMERRISDAFLVQFPLSGRVDLVVDGREVRAGVGAGVVVSPSQHVRRTGGPGWVLAIRMTGDLMRSRLETRMGRSPAAPLIFQPLISSGADELLNYALLIVEAIDRGVAPAGSSVATTLEDGLANLLLDLQPHNQVTSLSRQEMAARSARIRAVVAHVEKDPQRSPSVTEMARVAGCSVRALQAAFRELCGTSPTEYIKRHRMVLARKALENATPSRSVSAVALETGFTHAGRFAADYRALFGEAPSETLRRSVARRKGPRP